MRTARRLLALFLFGAPIVAGSCGGADDPTIDDPNLLTSSSAPPGATACANVRQDLEGLRQTLGVPDGIEELKQMLADALDQIGAAVRDAGDLAGEAARPVRDALSEAWANAGRALAAVADGNFGLAREELGQAKDDVRRAWDRLAAVCGSS
ncbi:MAG: hypothetical protein AB1679_16235 [Actinomycetota bacterium]|jgi:hypothetical protein